MPRSLSKGIMACVAPMFTQREEGRDAVLKNLIGLESPMVTLATLSDILRT